MPSLPPEDFDQRVERVRTASDQLWSASLAISVVRQHTYVLPACMVDLEGKSSMGHHLKTFEGGTRKFADPVKGFVVVVSLAGVSVPLHVMVQAGRSSIFGGKGGVGVKAP